MVSVRVAAYAGGVWVASMPATPAVATVAVRSTVLRLTGVVDKMQGACVCIGLFLPCRRSGAGGLAARCKYSMAFSATVAATPGVQVSMPGATHGCSGARKDP